MRNILVTLLLVTMTAVGVAAWQAAESDRDDFLEATLDNLVAYSDAIRNIWQD